MVLIILDVLMIAPLLAFGAYRWSLGRKVLGTREYPPSGLRLIRDTAVVDGERAIVCGHLLKAFALAFGIASFVLGLLRWRLASWLSGHGHGRHAAADERG